MVFINLVHSSPASFNARRKPWMVGDDFTLSLTAHCFTSGLSDFPGDERGRFLDCWDCWVSKRSREAKASERSGVESVIEAKLRVSVESSTEFSAGEVSSGVSSTVVSIWEFSEAWEVVGLGGSVRTRSSTHMWLKRERCFGQFFTTCSVEPQQ